MPQRDKLDLPRLVATPDRLPDIPGGWKDDDVAISGDTFRLTIPADPDAFLEDQATQTAHLRDGSMPYWPYLWPAALWMARAVAAVDRLPAGPALELGCGIGLVGLTLLSRGIELTFSDYEQTAVETSLHNAGTHGFSFAEGLVFDWRSVRLPKKYAFLVGCDVTYELANHEPILDLVEQTLSTGGTGWFGDPGRQHTEHFIELARQRGYGVELFDKTARRVKDPRVAEFRLIVLRPSPG